MIISEYDSINQKSQLIQKSQSRIFYQSFSRSELLLLLLFTILLFDSRMPNRFNGFLWAEDGRIFIKEAYQMGWYSIFHPYAGYLHVLPRLIAWIYSCFGRPESIPKIFVWISIIISAFSVTYIGAIVSRYLPRFAAIAVALVPVAILNNGEVWLNITNLQWVLSPLLAIMLWEMVAADDSIKMSRAKSLLKSAILIVLITTGPFGMVLGFFTIIAMILRKTKGLSLPDTKMLFPFLFGFSVQLFVILSMIHYEIKKSPTIHNYAFFDWISAFMNFIVSDLLNSPKFININPFALCSIVVIVVISLMVLSAKNQWKITILSLLMIMLAFWLLASIRDPTPMTGMKGNRYSYLPYIFTSWALILGMVATNKVWIRAVACVMIGSIFLTSLGEWRCIQGPRPKIRALGNGKYYSINMPPSEDWNFTFSCPGSQHISSEPVLSQEQK